MSEHRTHATLNVVDLWCDTCRLPMNWDGMQKLCDPPQYAYRCPRCGEVETVERRYPALECIATDGSVVFRSPA